MRRSLLVVVSIASALAMAIDAPAMGATRSGPPLHARAAGLDGALACPVPFHHPEHPAVLLVHGTATTPEASWSWNYQQSLPAAGWDVCTVRLPDRAMGDIQAASEYVVSAVRTMH